MRRGWILAEAALICCEMTEKDQIDSDKHTAEKTYVSRRVQELKKLEENLDAATRLNDPFVIEEICIAYWNMLLPCMKPKSRSYFRNFFSKCVNALEQIESTLNLLQVQYHNEITLCEIDADFVEKVHLLFFGITIVGIFSYRQSFRIRLYNSYKKLTGRISTSY